MAVLEKVDPVVLYDGDGTALPPNFYLIPEPAEGGDIFVPMSRDLVDWLQYVYIWEPKIREHYGWA